MKIVSLDIETTGLDSNNDEILQIGAVLFDTCSTNFCAISTFNKYIVQKQLHGGNIISLDMNKKIISRIVELLNTNEKLLNIIKQIFLDENIDKKDELQKTYNDLYESTHFEEYSTIDTITQEFKKWLIDSNAYTYVNGKNKLNVCGKNFFAFDDKFLNMLPGWTDEIRFMRRSIDPCALYVKNDDLFAPSLIQCKQRAIESTKSLPKEYVLFETDVVTHDATDDAMDVAKLIWYSMNYYNLFQKS